MVSKKGRQTYIVSVAGIHKPWKRHANQLVPVAPPRDVYVPYTLRAPEQPTPSNEITPPKVMETVQPAHNVPPRYNLRSRCKPACQIQE